ncbi:hypothetical protein [Allosalinactinospora lopnorensis]|uniref:hypothetical protein n=1 Tax=Allosalinactinospora lopnorensis TaxID=1352348 RepID=UPI000623FFCB|nr:hypothetical protein [Allosalinactinospora lopnorensis]
MVKGPGNRGWAGLASAVLAGAVAASAGPAQASGAWSTMHGGPNLGGSFGAVAAGDSMNIWAFGDTSAQNDGTTWVHHWDGAGWSQESTPGDWTLRPVVADASGPRDVWAAGDSPEGGAGILHYDGEEWSSVEFGRTLFPTGIEALAPDDVWLLSESADAAERAMRFDGDSWGTAPAPRVRHALSGADSDTLVAVGSVAGQPAADLWDGGEWRPLNVPEVELPPGESSAGFTDVLARAADDVWAVGRLHYKDEEERNHYRPLLAHWDGAEWDLTVEERDAGYDAVVDDGANGLWIAEGAWNPVLVHRAADGAEERHEMADDDYDLSIPALTHVPDTTAAVAAGTAFEKGDPDVFTDHGVVFGHGI